MRIFLLLLVALAIARAAAEDAAWLSIEGGKVIVASDYPDINAAVDALPPPGGVVFIPPGTYELARPLNLADTYGPYAGEKVRRISLVGGGANNTIITGDFPDQPLVDATNCAAMRVRGVHFTGNCKAIWLSGRRNFGGGGGQVFEDCRFTAGASTEVVVWLLASEVNRFWACEIRTRVRDGIGIAFTPTPRFRARGIDYEIASPYVGDELTGGSTTALFIQGSMIHSFGYNSIGLYAKGSTADICVSDCYNANMGFASFYLDGSDANVGDSSFRNIRIEGGRGGLYCLYAVGAVRNVTIESGCWSSAEIIRYVANTDGFAADVGAENWVIGAKSLVLPDYRAKRTEATAALLDVPSGERALIRADRMKNWRIDNQWALAYALGTEAAAAPGDEATVPTVDVGDQRLARYRPKLVVCSDWAEGNTIVAGRREDVLLPADPAKARGNRIECLADGDVRRTYLSGGTAPTITNLDPTAVTAIRAPRTGDLAMDNGTLRGDGRPVLVYYDGQAWIPVGPASQ